MKYRWVAGGGGATSQINAGKHSAERGETIELTDAQYAFFTGRGFVLEPADRRRKSPAVEEVPGTEMAESADE